MRFVRYRMPPPAWRGEGEGMGKSGQLPAVSLPSFLPSSNPRSSRVTPPLINDVGHHQAQCPLQPRRKRRMRRTIEIISAKDRKALDLFSKASSASFPDAGLMGSNFGWN